MISDSTDFRIFEFEDGAPRDAPFLDGHFPENPIVPGAVLLGYAADALAEHGNEIASVLRMKFMRPLLPETPFIVEATETSGGTTLVWKNNSIVFAKARVTLRVNDG